MNILWTEQAWSEYIYWYDTDKKIVKRINVLIKEIQRTPYAGIGNPEPLKHQWSGFWSRRINHEHRLIYKVDEAGLAIVQCRYHY